MGGVGCLRGRGGEVDGWWVGGCGVGGVESDQLLLLVNMEQHLRFSRLNFYIMG